MVLTKKQETATFGIVRIHQIQIELLSVVVLFWHEYIWAPPIFAYFTIKFTLSKAQKPLEVEGYRIRGTVYRDMCGKITVNPRLELVKIVVIR